MNENYDIQMIQKQKELESASIMALMGQIVYSTPERPIIGTMALASCYGIIFYDRENKFAIVGHANPSSRIKIMDRMMDFVKKIGCNNIEYAVINGYFNVQKKNYKGEFELLKFLEEKSRNLNINIKPLQTDLGVQLDKKKEGYEFAFDVNSGKSVSEYYFYFTQIIDEDKSRCFY